MPRGQRAGMVAVWGDEAAVGTNSRGGALHLLLSAGGRSHGRDKKSGGMQHKSRRNTDGGLDEGRHRGDGRMENCAPGLTSDDKRRN